MIVRFDFTRDRKRCKFQLLSLEFVDILQGLSIVYNIAVGSVRKFFNDLLRWVLVSLPSRRVYPRPTASSAGGMRSRVLVQKEKTMLQESIHQCAGLGALRERHTSFGRRHCLSSHI